ncbi:type IV secretory system conjugative DNA transfer family protein [Pseudonocardia bannensis]|uniref:Type IV secretory system conjugative DNA transfer family protein n=1 Tax=Pseudonocardia bannensis TaxID=630973 RepID=A0A848DT71_9PSEU|nr:TraM recognition domain-containing protein [Pseudonocardia bannensis]NMH95596.1 type IV secretory system conjugative DNA transfer family protein [Pseudonocardia bannensis]
MNLWSIVLVVAPIAAAVVAAKKGAKLLAGVCGLVALLSLWAALSVIGLPLLLVASAMAVLVGWHRWTRSSSMVTRWGARARRKAGVASTLDVLRHAGGLAMRRRAGAVRPSLAGLGWPDLARLPVVEVAVRLCQAGLVWVWSSIEDVTLIFGGPRTGKSGWLAGQILDAPGAALVASTRTDLHDLTAARRAQRGPVLVFNAVGLGHLVSTVTFNPVDGCGDPVTAAERAADMLTATTRASGSGDREFWDAQGRRVLAALLHAAALGNRTMRDVLGWLADPAKAAKDVTVLLRRSPEPAFELDLGQFLTTNDRTRSSITSTIMPALGWLTSPTACAAAGLDDDPGHAGRPLDVAELLASNGTVYLVGGEEAQVAPLVAALTGHVARQARRIAATKPGGRLDPPLRLALDEAALICPVPLESWTADMGGRGVNIIAAFQSRAQLLARYGTHDAATILNNAGAVMVFGGTRDRDDLQFWSTLTGDRDEPADTVDPTGRTTARTSRKTAVLSPAQIANLPAGRVLVIRRGIAPVIGRAQMFWQRPDIRRERFAADHPELVQRLVRITAWCRAFPGRITRRVGRRRAARVAIAALPAGPIVGAVEPVDAPEAGRPRLVVVDALPTNPSSPESDGGADRGGDRGGVA